LAILQEASGGLKESEVSLTAAVRLAVLVGDRSVAADLRKRAEALPLRHEVPRRAAVALHCRGLLDADPALLLQAAEQYERARRPLSRAQALEAAARLLADRGDTAAARGPFAASHQLYAALGAEWDVTRMRAEFRPYGLRPAVRRQRRPATGWDALTPVEAKVVSLVAAGLSNPQIAERLLVSRYTVETHVAQALAKVGVRSR
jgi:DNA-binding CsgD family transcriptional regulator